MAQPEIRLEAPGDLEAVRAIHREAFGGEAEANLVDALRSGGWSRISLVAVQEAQVVAHVLLSGITIDSREHSLPALALAPVAVLPKHQRRGIGTALVRQSLSLARACGHRVVIVLGDPAYYSRFGFSAALAANLRSRFYCEAFQVLALAPGALEGVTGEVRYSPPFAAF